MAIELPAPVRDALRQAIEPMRADAYPVRWVEPDRYHVTLKFLGACPTAKVPGIESSMDAAVREIPCFRITLGKVVPMPSSRRPDMIWVDVEEPTGVLGRLKRALDFELGLQGFATEERRFRPHVTLGRVRRPATEPQRSAFGARFASGKVGARSVELEELEVEVRDIALMRSDAMRGGVRYTRVAAVELDRLVCAAR